MLRSMDASDSDRRCGRILYVLPYRAIADPLELDGKETEKQAGGTKERCTRLTSNRLWKEGPTGRRPWEDKANARDRSDRQPKPTGK